MHYKEPRFRYWLEWAENSLSFILSPRPRDGIYIPGPTHIEGDELPVFLSLEEDLDMDLLYVEAADAYRSGETWGEFAPIRFKTHSW